MYTSMALLKENNACVGGFTRMASFIGVKPPAKQILFPIWMVGLLGTKDDLTWAIENAMLIDRSQFNELLERTKLQVFHMKLWKFYDGQASSISNAAAGSTLQQVFDHAKTVNTLEEMTVFFDKWSNRSSSARIWRDVILWSGWYTPSEYLDFLVENLTTPISTSHKAFLTGTKIEPGETRRTPAARKYVPSRKAAVNKRDRYFPARPGMSSQEVFASLMIGGDADPYTVALEFLNRASFLKAARVPVVLTQLNGVDDKPPVFQATFNTTDPGLIFRLIHLCQASKFDVNAVFGLSKAVNAIDRLTDGSIRNPSHLSDLSEQSDADVRETVETALEEDRTHSIGRSSSDGDSEGEESSEESAVSWSVIDRRPGTSARSL